MTDKEWRVIVRKLLQIDFNFAGPFGEEMSQTLVGLAESINHEPGFIWKIWTENQADQVAGGIYLFEDEATAKAYLKMHSARLKELGVKKVRGQIFDVNVPLSTLNKSPFF